MCTDKISKTCVPLFSLIPFSFSDTNLSSFLDELYNTHTFEISAGVTFPHSAWSSTLSIMIPT